jgi:sortase A
VKRWLRILGTLALGAGLLAGAWAFTVWRWQDPFTALYTAHAQKGLEKEFAREQATYTPPRRPKRHTTVADEERIVAGEARRFRRQLKVGEAVGRLRVPRLGLNAIVVNGTDHDSLTKGPGRYTGSYLPGQGELIYIAGHRTTYSAPFAHIERLRPGDVVTLDVPYGHFAYRVRNSEIVPADDIAKLRSTGHEVVALQACHPRFFATERYIVYARPVAVDPRGGRPYKVGAVPQSGK